MRVAESILDGVCIAKFPDTPSLRSKGTPVVKSDSKKPKKKKFDIDTFVKRQIDNANKVELMELVEREESMMDGVDEFGKKSSDYTFIPKTREQRLQDIEDAKIYRLGEMIDGDY